MFLYSISRNIQWYCIAQKLQVYFLSCVGIYKEKCCQVRSLSVFHFSLTLSICLSVSFSFSHQHKHITHTHSHIFSLSPFLSPLKIRPCPSPYPCVGNPAKMCWELNLSFKNCLQIFYKTFFSSRFRNVKLETVNFLI
jgi:hypothetical protein